MMMTHFGVTRDGRPVDQITLDNGQIRCQILTYGGALQSLTVPGKNGSVDVVLGFDSVADYETQDKYIGALVGRYANRIANARFTLDGKVYPLACNDGENHLHGGLVGFDKKIWQAEEVENGVSLRYVSADGEEGYPGELTAVVTYQLQGKSLVISYQAVSTAPTVCNLTCHAYFNLNGHAQGQAMEQNLCIHAQKYTPVRAGSIPTGELAPVEGTPMDFRSAHVIGERIDAPFQQLELCGGYDHNWVIDGDIGTLRPAVTLASTKTGITMDVETTLPGVQVYAGNFLDGCPNGKGGAPYGHRDGVAIETQCFPDSPNKEVFPGCILRPGETWRHQTVFRFS